MRRDAFAGFHPAVNLCFFAVAIGLTMFLMHPVFLAISLVCSGAYLWYLQGARGFWRQVGFLVPVLVFTAALNPLFNHEGVTVLFYLKNGNPVTLEALCFGLASAVLMGRPSSGSPAATRFLPRIRSFFCLAGSFPVCRC